MENEKMNDINDPQLVIKLSQGDSEAWTVLCRFLYKNAWVHFSGRGEEFCMEVVQEVCVDLWKKVRFKFQMINAKFSSLLIQRVIWKGLEKIRSISSALPCQDVAKKPDSETDDVPAELTGCIDEILKRNDRKSETLQTILTENEPFPMPNDFRRNKFRVLQNLKDCLKRKGGEV
jgi:hypothetical protein